MNYLGQLSGERILITGASGFLGSHVCDRLQKTVQKCMVFLEKAHQWYKCTLVGNMEDIEVVQNLSVPLNLRLFSSIRSCSCWIWNSAHFHSLLVSTVNLLTVAANIGCRRIVLLASLEEPGHTDAAPALPTQLLSGLVAPMVVCFISSIRHL